MIHYTTKDLLYDNSCYNTSFFQIFLKAVYNPDLSQMTKSALGTFVHEYVHYLQNVSTPWGLYSSLIRYKAVAAIIKQLIDASEVKLPFQPTFDETLQKEIDIMMVGEGTCKFDDYYGKQLDTTKIVNLIPEPIEYNGRTIDRLALEIFFTNGESHKIFLGAKIIKESMASLYQCLFDLNAMSQHDVPYNLVRILFEQCCPNISHDIKKIITICQLSLYSMRPVEVLLDRMDFANKHPDLSSMDLVDDFINNHPISTSSAEEMGIPEFFDNMIDSFSEILKALTRTEIPFMSRVFDNAKLKNGYIPVLNILYGHDNPMSVEHIKSLTDYMGIPYLTTDRGQTVWGTLIEDEAIGNMPNDIAALRAITLIVDYLTIRHRTTYCLAFKHECDGRAKQDYECLDSPWKGEECPFTQILETFGIDKNKIAGWE